MQAYDEEESSQELEGNMFDPGVNPSGSAVVVGDAEDEFEDQREEHRIEEEVMPGHRGNSSSSVGKGSKTRVLPKTRTSSRPGRSNNKSSSSSRTRPVVKLLVTSVTRSYSEPWRRRPQSSSSGTGFLIRWDASEPCQGVPETQQQQAAAAVEAVALNDKLKEQSPSKNHLPLRIVTNAHVIRNASTVRARASFGPLVVNCQVEWISLPLDLALLKILEEDDFLKGWSASVTHIKTIAAKSGPIVAKNQPDVAINNSASNGADSNTITNDDDPEITPSDHQGNNVSDVVTKSTATATNNTTVATEPRPTSPNPKPLAKHPTPFSNTVNIQHLSLSTKLPQLDENVTCVGFPQGGTQISVTRGVVSRIDVDSQYVLRIQIDAAVNSGNSGGPVFDEKGQVVGVATSTLRGAGNIGYIIPSKIVSMFLQMCKDGLEAHVDERYGGLGSLVSQNQSDFDSNDHQPKHVPGIPLLGIHGAQTLESKALRRSLGLEELDISGGVRIVGVMDSSSRKRKNLTSEQEETVNNENIDNDTDVGGSETNDNNSNNTILADDVLLAINHIPIGMDGTIQLSPNRPDERINFRSLVTCRRAGSIITLNVLRERQQKTLEVTLKTCRFLVPKYDGFDAFPFYVVCGGCVFSPLSIPLVSDKTTKRRNPMSGFSRYYQELRQNHDQVLVLSKVLADEVNVGYHGWSNLILNSVNGHRPRNMQELVDVIVMKVHDEMLEFRCKFVGLDDAEFVICMDMKEVIDSERRILHRHMIASWCSADALSKDLRNEMNKLLLPESEKKICWNSMNQLRKVLNAKSKSEKVTS